MALEEYNEFVRLHPQQVKRMEEMGRLVTMMLPVSRLGKYSEVFTESTYSVLGLVGLYHDRVIQGTSNTLSSGPRHILRLILTLVTHTEVTLEMLSKLLGGDQMRLFYIFMVELSKAISRLVLLFGGKTKLLISGGHYEAAKKDAVPPVEDAVQPAVSQPTLRSPQWQGRRSGKVVQLPNELTSFSNVSEPPTSDSAPPRFVDTPENAILQTFGEVVYITRPLVYVCHLRISSKDSWRPWMVSLMLELVSLRSSSLCTSPTCIEDQKLHPAMRAMKKFINGSGGMPDKTMDDELKRRRTLLVLYLMRAPLFDTLTLPAVQRVAARFSSIPAVGSTISNIMVETLMYYHRNHFYISGS